MYQSADGYFMAVLIGGLLVVVAWTVVRVCIPPLGTGKNAACGACHFDLSETGHIGVADEGGAARCPECGADLRRVGVVTRRVALRYQGGLIGAVIAWTTLCAAIGYGFNHIASQWVGMYYGQQTGWATGYAFTKTFAVEPARWYDSAVGAYQQSADYQLEWNLDVTTEASMRATAGTIAVVLLIDTETIGTLAYDIETRDASVTDADDNEVAAFDEPHIDAVNALYALAGLDPSDKMLAKECRELVAAFEAAEANAQQVGSGQRIVNGQWAASSRLVDDSERDLPSGLECDPSTVSWGTYTQVAGNVSDWLAPFGITVVSASGAALLIYVVGLVVIILLRRRVMRTAS